MQNTVAVLEVRSAKVFNWLGHMPILNWSVCQLLEVRGIARTWCCAAADLAEQARRLLTRVDIDLLVLPPALDRLGERDFDAWLCAAAGPAAEADAVVVVTPTLPFLPAAKIEACLDLVSRKFADLCCTVHPVHTWSAGGRAAAHAAVPGCRAFAPARLSERPPAVRYRHVEVSLIESLDVADPDNDILARALVAGGHAL